MKTNYFKKLVLSCALAGIALMSAQTQNERAKITESYHKKSMKSMSNAFLLKEKFQKETK